MYVPTVYPGSRGRGVTCRRNIGVHPDPPRLNLNPYTCDRLLSAVRSKESDDNLVNSHLGSTWTVTTSRERLGREVDDPRVVDRALRSQACRHEDTAVSDTTSRDGPGTGRIDTLVIGRTRSGHLRWRLIVSLRRNKDSVRPSRPSSSAIRVPAGWCVSDEELVSVL